MSTVTVNETKYILSALPLKVLRANWDRLLGLITPVLGLIRAVAGVAKGSIDLDGGVDRSRLIAELASETFPTLVTKALESLSVEQLDAVLDLVWESFRKRSPGLSREQFDDLMTVDVAPTVFLAFLEAQGLRWGSGEAKPG